jgi:hypothetical protein
MSSGFEVFRAKWFSAKLRDLLPLLGVPAWCMWVLVLRLVGVGT